MTVHVQEHMTRPEGSNRQRGSQLPIAQLSQHQIQDDEHMQPWAHRDKRGMSQELKAHQSITSGVFLLSSGSSARAAVSYSSSSEGGRSRSAR